MDHYICTFGYSDVVLSLLEKPSQRACSVLSLDSRSWALVAAGRHPCSPDGAAAQVRSRPPTGCPESASLRVGSVPCPAACPLSTPAVARRAPAQTRGARLFAVGATFSRATPARKPESGASLDGALEHESGGLLYREPLAMGRRQTDILREGAGQLVQNTVPAHCRSGTVIQTNVGSPERERVGAVCVLAAAHRACTHTHTHTHTHTFASVRVCARHTDV